MMRPVLLSLTLALVLATPAWAAEEFIFACKNNWNQEVQVKVVADTQKEARTKLKNPPYKSDYSLCTLRGHRPVEPVILPNDTEDEEAFESEE